VFYRQGIVYNVDSENIKECYENKIVDRDLGDVVFWKNKVIIARSS
jgi:hypothetical protein